MVRTIRYTPNPEAFHTQQVMITAGDLRTGSQKSLGSTRHGLWRGPPGKSALFLRTATRSTVRTTARLLTLPRGTRQNARTTFGAITLTSKIAG